MQSSSSPRVAAPQKNGPEKRRQSLLSCALQINLVQLQSAKVSPTVPKREIKIFLIRIQNVVKEESQGTIMGIAGLLPQLRSITKKANVSKYSGQTVAVDAYCLLHKGAYSCARELVEGERTNK
jgi:hypothetical protein